VISDFKIHWFLPWFLDFGFDFCWFLSRVYEISAVSDPSTVQLIIQQVPKFNFPVCQLVKAVSCVAFGQHIMWGLRCNPSLLPSQWSSFIWRQISANIHVDINSTCFQFPSLKWISTLNICFNFNMFHSLMLIWILNMSNLSEIQYWSIDIEVIFNVEVSKQVENASLHEFEKWILAVIYSTALNIRQY
jgi:hypothetical protein